MMLLMLLMLSFFELVVGERVFEETSCCEIMKSAPFFL
jgi:hypothetical protein